MTFDRLAFDTVIFAGGGSRCFWQAGFWERVRPALVRPPERLLGVSAGAMVAVASSAGLTTSLLATTADAFESNSVNFQLSAVLSSKNPFPHEAIVRAAFDALFDEAAMARLADETPVHVLAAGLPHALPSFVASPLAQIAFVLEKASGRCLHGTWGMKLGFEPIWREASACRSPTVLRELLLASSAIPPAFPVRRFEGRRAMDGGFVGNALVEFDGRDLGRTLVLVTRHDWEIPEDDGRRRYERPCAPSPVSKLDATSGARIRAAFSLGEADGSRFLDKFA